MKYIPFLLVFAAFFAACREDDLPPSIPQPPAPPADEVEVFAPCDLSESGEAGAIKISAEWKATAKCRHFFYQGKKYWTIELFTCSKYNDNEFRELIFLSHIPDENPVQMYSLNNDGNSIIENSLNAHYVRLRDDGDVIDDRYDCDTTALNDYLIIDTWDTINKQIEGRFRVSFVVRQPQRNPDNPEKVKFWKGTFKLPLRD
ncbi:MAG: hypothetical protein U0U46_03665 [Saprospiraceae bacterium]